MIDNEHNVTEVEANTVGYITTGLLVGDYKVVRATDAKMTFAEVDNIKAFSIRKDRLTIVDLKI